MPSHVRPVPAVIATVFGALALTGLVARFRFWDFDLFFMYQIAFEALIAVFSGWVAMRSHVPSSHRNMRSMIRGGSILGGIGFAAGFAGPMLVGAGSPQGPLLGIFITGPIGLVLGGFIGWFYAWFRRADLERLV